MFECLAAAANILVS